MQVVFRPETSIKVKSHAIGSRSKDTFLRTIKQIGMANNDNVISRIEIYNVNDNVSNVYKKTENQVNSIADGIEKRLKGGELSWEYYCLVAANLSESIINSNIELATAKGRNPQKYFTWLCNRYPEIKNKLNKSKSS